MRIAKLRGFLQDFDPVEAGQQLVYSLEILLSTVVISGINIAVSGHLLSYTLNLRGTGKDHFTLRIPLLFRLAIRGKQVVAGFAAFSVSLLLVGLFLSDLASTVIITNLQATSSQWIACQLMAALLSVAGCIIFGTMRMSWLFISTSIAQRRQPPIPSPEARAQDLVREEIGSGQQQ